MKSKDHRSQVPTAQRGDDGAPPRRAYAMRARAEAAEATRERLIAAATRRFLAAAYDEVSLEELAGKASVSLPTVLRHFGSKEALFSECARIFAVEELAHRQVEPGDLHAAARVLAERYETFSAAWWRYQA